jgi:hypothetical protein
MAEEGVGSDGALERPEDTKRIQVIPQGEDIVQALEERLELKEQETVKPDKEVVRPMKEKVRQPAFSGADKDRDSWLNRNIASVLAIMILGAAFLFFAYVLNFDFSEKSKLKDIVILLIGIISTLAITVVTYYFGSSHGSSNKSKFIQDGKK